MKSATCPICKKTFAFERLTDQPFFPFCTERCKLVDLGRWIDGSYKISRELNDDELELIEELIERQLDDLENERPES